MIVGTRDAVGDARDGGVGVIVGSEVGVPVLGGGTSVFASKVDALEVAVLLLVSKVDATEVATALSFASKVDAIEVILEVAVASLLGASTGDLRLSRLHARMTSSEALMISKVFFFIEILLWTLMETSIGYDDIFVSEKQ